MSAPRHLSFCRKQVEHVMPNYGSECTCGYEVLLEILTEPLEKMDDVGEIAQFLNERIMWMEKPGYESIDWANKEEY